MKLTADWKGVQKAITTAKADITRRFTKGTFKARLGADYSASKKAVTAARKDITTRFSRGVFKARLGADYTTLSRNITTAKKQITSRYTKGTYKANLGADAKRLTAALQEAEARLSKWNGKEFTANLTANATRADRAVDRAQREAKDYARRVYEATLDADPSDVARAVAVANRQGNRFARAQFVASLELRGVAETLALFKEVDREADKLDGRNIRMRFSTSNLGVLKNLSGGFAQLASDLRNAETIFAAFTIPVAIGAAIPTVAALSASVVGLASALGSSLVGASVAAAGALGTLAGAIGIVAAPVNQLVQTLQKYSTKLNTVRADQKAAEQAARSLADAHRGVEDAERNLARVTAERGKAIKDAEAAVAEARRSGNASVATAETALRDVRRQGIQDVASAEDALSEARRQGVRSVTSAEQALADARRNSTRNVKSAEEALAQARRDAVRSVADQERALKETRQSARESEKQAEQDLAETRKSAVESVETQEQSLKDARESAAANTAQAEQELRSARQSLTASTRSLTLAQQELNRAEEDEPLRQEQATLNLASARDAASDAQRNYNKAVAEFGPNSEEATDALREMQQANLDLQTTERETQRTRRDGSDELQSAREQANQAAKEQKDNAKAVTEQEKNLRKTRTEGHQEVRDQAKELVKVQKESNQAIEESARALRKSRKEGAAQIAEQERLLRRTQTDTARNIAEQQTALVQARADGAREVARTAKALRQVESDSARNIRDLQEALAQTRQDSARDERRALQDLVETRKQRYRDLKDAEENLAETRKQTAQQVADAERALTEELRQQRRAVDDLRKAKEKLKRDNTLLTDSEKDLYNRLKEFRRQSDRAFQPATNSLARLGIKILNVADDYLPKLGRVSKRTVDVISGVFDHFRKEFEKPLTQSGFNAFLQEIPRFTKVAGTALADLSVALFNVFVKTLPYQRKLTSGLADLARRFLRFTQSAQGQNQLEQWFAGAWRRAKQLWNILKDLGRFIGNLFDAANETGLTDQAFRGLATFASGLEKITRKGSEGRKTLNHFFKESKRLMRTVGNTAIGLAKQLGRVTNAFISFREKGHRLTVVQELFRNIRRAAKPMASALIEVWENLAPQIRRVIPPLSRFLRTLGRGVSGTIAIFLRLWTRVFRVFNHLPRSVQAAIVQLAAFKLALKFTGLGSLIALFAGLIKRFTGLFGISKKLGAKAGLSAVAAGLGGIGAVLAGGIGIAALALAFHHVYENNKLVRGAVNRLADDLTKKFIPGAKNAKDAVNKFKDAFGKGLNKKLDSLGDAIVDIFDLRRKNKQRKLKQFGRSGAEAYANGIRVEARSMDKDGAPGDELADKIAQQISNGINAALERKGKQKGGIPGIGAAKWARLMLPTTLATAIGGWFGKHVTPKVLKDIHWGDFKRFAGDQLAFVFNLGGLVPYMTKQTNKHIIQPIVNTFKHHSWGQLGRDAVVGIVKGFTGVNLGELMQGHIGAALGYVKKKNRGRSPWGSTKDMGRDAGRGFSKGVDRSKPEIRRSASGAATTLIDRLRSDLRQGIQNTKIGQWLKDKIADAKRALGNAVSFFSSGKSAALGFADGFNAVDIGSYLVKKIQQAREWVKRFQKEHSPSKLWAEQGRNAALGWSYGVESAQADVNRSATDMAREAFDAASEGQDAALRSARRQAEAVRDSYMQANKARADGARQAAKIEADYAKHITKIQSDAQKAQAKAQRDAQKERLDTEKRFAKFMERNLNDQAKRTAQVNRDAAKQASGLNRTYDRFSERAREGGATPEQLAAIEQDRTRRLEATEKARAKNVAEIEKQSARERKTLEKERQQDLRRIAKESAKEQEQIQKRSEREIYRATKENHRKLLENARQTDKKLESIAKQSAREQKQIAQKGLRQQKAYYDKQLRQERQHRQRQDAQRTKNVSRGQRHAGMVQAEDGSWVPRSFYSRDRQRRAYAEFQETRLRRLQETIRNAGQLHRNAQREVRSPDSPGGTAITQREMQEVMRIERAAQLQVMRAAAAATVGLPEFMRFMDAAIARGLDYHNDMKADAR